MIPTLSFPSPFQYVKATRNSERSRTFFNRPRVRTQSYRASSFRQILGKKKEKAAGGGDAYADLNIGTSSRLGLLASFDFQGVIGDPEITTII